MRKIDTYQTLTSNQQGFSLIEAIISLFLVSTMALSICNSSLTSLKVLSRSEYNNYATQLAMRKMEEWSAKNPTSYSGGTTTENDVIIDKVKFDRVSIVAVNADSSRTVTVTVTAQRAGFSGLASFSNTYALWGKS